MPAGVLPKNGSRVSEVAAIDVEKIGQASSSLARRPFVVRLKCGRTLHDVDHIIICTGYLFTLSFLPQHNDGDTAPVDANDEVLITDGGQVHNLHRDIFYIPDPTLAFVGIPIFTTTFTLFEFQAITIATFFSGLTKLPSPEAMKEEYEDRVRRKGYGRLLHSLMGEEETYVGRLIDWVNEGRTKHGLAPVEGHTALWKEEKELIQQEIMRLRAVKAAEKLRAAEKLNADGVLRNDNEVVA